MTICIRKRSSVATLLVYKGTNSLYLFFFAFYSGSLGRTGPLLSSGVNKSRGERRAVRVFWASPGLARRWPGRGNRSQKQRGNGDDVAARFLLLGGVNGQDWGEG